jgi:hypothetical protein
MHGTNPSVWIEASLLRYNVGYVKYLSVRLWHFVYEVYHG